MTISDFDWSDFWATAGSASWLEIGALLALAVVWRRARVAKRAGSDGQSETDVRLLFFLAAAFAFELLRKLFEDLDVVALLSAALLLGATFDYWKARSRRRRERRAAELEKRKLDAARRRAFFSGSDAEDSSRRRRSSRSGRRESGRSRSGRSERERLERSERFGSKREDAGATENAGTSRVRRDDERNERRDGENDE